MSYASQITPWCREIYRCPWPGCNDLTPESRARGFGPGGRNTSLIVATLGDWWWQDPERFLGELGEALVTDFDGDPFRGIDHPNSVRLGLVRG